jgi:phosphoglucosamine mutase
MARKLFGTDGVRGRANDAPMTAETALRLGQAAGRYFTNGGHTHRALIGKDTRRSGYMLETALTAGFTSVGMASSSSDRSRRRRSACSPARCAPTSA